MLKKIKKQELSFLATTTSFFLEDFNPTYKWKTEIISQNTNKQYEAFPLLDNIAKHANKTNNFLNSKYKDFFDTKIIRNPKKGRKLHLENGGILLNITTDNNKIIRCTYFDRKKKKLLIIGAGFTNAREIMTPFIAMFENYDLLIFDYCGYGYKETSWIKPWQWKYNPASKILGVDNTRTKLGEIEETDIFTIVDTFRRLHKYDEINGLGICYSTLIFIKAQAIRQKEKQKKLFDKLILDGCGLSFDNLISKISEDPKLLFNPQKGGWSKKWLVKQQWFKNFLLWLGNTFGKKYIENIQTIDYIPLIQNTPLLLWHGKNDLTITRDEFETILQNINTTPTTAIVTSNPHVINHLKQKEFYKMACELFLDQKHNVFIEWLKGSQEVS